MSDDTPFIKAVRYRTFEEVNDLWSKGVEPYEIPEAFAAAVWHGKLKIVKLLWERYSTRKNCCFSIQDESYHLKIAIEHRKFKIVKFLIKNGVSIPGDYQSVLVIGHDEVDEKLVKFFWKLGVDIHAQDDLAIRRVIRQIEVGFVLRIMKSFGDLKPIKFFLKKNANIHTLNNVLLIEAIKSMKLFIRKGIAKQKLII